MEKLYKTAVLDEMFKTCRDILPVSRSMNDTDELMLLDCFQKFEPIFGKTAQQVLQARRRLLRDKSPRDLR